MGETNISQNIFPMVLMVLCMFWLYQFYISFFNMCCGWTDLAKVLLHRHWANLSRLHGFLCPSSEQSLVAFLAGEFPPLKTAKTGPEFRAVTCKNPRCRALFLGSGLELQHRHVWSLKHNDLDGKWFFWSHLFLRCCQVINDQAPIEFFDCLAVHLGLVWMRMSTQE